MITLIAQLVVESQGFPSLTPEAYDRLKDILITTTYCTDYVRGFLESSLSLGSLVGAILLLLSLGFGISWIFRRTRGTARDVSVHGLLLSLTIIGTGAIASSLMSQLGNIETALYYPGPCGPEVAKPLFWLYFVVTPLALYLAASFAYRRAVNTSVSFGWALMAGATLVFTSLLILFVLGMILTKITDIRVYV